MTHFQIANSHQSDDDHHVLEKFIFQMAGSQVSVPTALLGL